jgi:hypothetical protein
MGGEPHLPGPDWVHGIIPKNDARETQMLRINLKNPESGWAFADLSDGNDELTVTGPYSPVDVVRDLVDSVQSLQTADVADCCWSQKPGELHWKLRRTNEDLELEILRFSRGVIPGHHEGEAVSVFKSHTRWVIFARQLLSCLESIRTDMGSEGYELVWRHPFPTEAFEKLRMAIQREK